MRLYTLITAILVLLPAMASAEICERGQLIKAYGTVVAYSDTQPQIAQAVIRSLANSGFAPAQRRLGLLLKEDPGTLEEALFWLNLAVKGKDLRARRPRDQLGQMASLAMATKVDRRVEAWQPTEGFCAQAFKDYLADGKALGAGNFTQYLQVDNKLDRPFAIVSKQVAALMIELAKTDPGFYHYLTAIDSITVTQMKSVARMRDDGQRIWVELDADYLANPIPSGHPAVITAVRHAIHRQVEPLSVRSADYRGRRIVVRSYEDDQLALGLIKAALDLVEKLPPTLRVHAQQFTLMVSEPTNIGEVRRGVATPKKQADGSLFVLLSDLGGFRPVDIAAGLVAAGYHATIGKSAPETLDEANRLGYEARTILNKSN